MNNKKRYVHETEQNKQAFELYYGLSLKRNYAAVAKNFHKSVSTIKNWSRAFNWRQKIEEREAERLRIVEESSRSSQLEFAKNLLTIIKAALGNAMRNMVDGSTRPTGKSLCDILQARIDLEPGFNVNGAPPVNIIIVRDDE